jgi:hypothetical protein
MHLIKLALQVSRRDSESYQRNNGVARVFLESSRTVSYPASSLTMSNPDLPSSPVFSRGRDSQKLPDFHLDDCRATLDLTPMTTFFRLNDVTHVAKLYPHLFCELSEYFHSTRFYLSSLLFIRDCMIARYAIFTCYFVWSFGN